MVEEDKVFKQQIRENIVEPPANIAARYMNKEARKEIPTKIAEVFIEDLNRRYPSNTKAGKGMIVNRTVAVRGRGMPTTREANIAESYNESQLGANGGRGYFSL
jgi:hypothetical protein